MLEVDFGASGRNLLPAAPEITVFIPTFNGAERLEEILRSIESQHTKRSFEILIIDSGSTDGTIDIVKKHSWCRLYQIPNHEFQHGRTRNLAAAMANGKIVVYLTQSSTPAHDGWLESLVRHFDEEERVVAVYGRHLPRAGCNSYVAADVLNTFYWISPNGGVVYDCVESSEVLDKLPLNEFHRRRFYSDANSALRKSYWEQFPYPEVEYAEDQLFGQQVLRSGYVKVYEPQAAVFHSHHLRLDRYFQRRFDEYISLIQNGDLGLVRVGDILVGLMAKWVRALQYIYANNRFSLLKRGYCTGESFGYAIADQAALLLASRIDWLPKAIRRFLSLEKTQKIFSKGRNG